MPVSIIEGFQEETYLQELFEEKNVPQDHNSLIEVLLLLKKYEGNDLQIGYESTYFSGLKTLENYKIKIPVMDGYWCGIEIYDGKEENKFFITYSHFEYFRRLYEKFPQRQYQIGFKKEENINLAIF
ncbi:hypothetical protein CEQ83_02145 [Priestia megaterium]|uniref:hypothetical protein n=1 Tax=Priestia megaterium TaxID=1404 RepID=UPI0012A8D31B|nr:hypothetical protein [Priestia megaterium]QFY71366.1 hypothetical protein CEQ83_02145 [Priestia megaterium]